MSCRRFRDAISDHACGAPIDALALAHLSTCDDCKRAFQHDQEILRDVDAQLREALTVTASPVFVAGVGSRVRQGHSAPTSLPLVRRWCLAGAAAAVLVAGFYLGVPSLRTPREPLPGATPPPSGLPSQSASRTAPEVPDGAFSTATLARSPSPAAKSIRLPRPARLRSQEPDVIVPRDQMRAIARLTELVQRGVIDEPTSMRSNVAELVIEPLVIPLIGNSQTGTGPPSAERDPKAETKE